jgi:glycosyltransferase involved in cell wall biosynthesis
MSALRVLALIDSLNAGGAEALLADFAVGAPAAGLELHVAHLGEQAGNPGAVPLREQGIESVNLGLRGLLDPASFRRVRGHVAALAPDVVHTHLAYADAVGGLAARSLRLPAVSTVHVMEWDRAPKERVRQRLIALARRRCAARVVAVSDAARIAFLQTGWEPPERVVTVHNGIAARTAPGAGAAVRAELGIGLDELVVGQLGVLRVGKNHALTAAAMTAVAERVPGARLLVIGDGPERPAVERALAPLGDRALLAGHRSDVMAVLDAVDVLVHPSRVDAFPTALLEALAAGVPVVATTVGGIPEIVADGETGVLVPPQPSPQVLSNALAGLLADSEGRARMAAAGRERFEREFTAERWAQRTRALYDEVLAAGRSV